MSDPYRLGPALLHTSDDSSAHAPETFRSALLRALDSRSRLRVALTCKAGLRWLLTDWTDSAALQLSVRPSRAEVPDSATLRRMLRASQWLSVRGDQPLRLTLVQQGQGPSAEGYWHAVVAALGSGHALTGLSLSLQIQHISASLLQLVGSTFSGLTLLSIGRDTDTDSDSGSTAELPPPNSLPVLRHLTVLSMCKDSQAALWPSVAPYLPQLTSLSLAEQPYVADSWPQWAALFTAPAASPNTTLAHLSLAETLYPESARLLCEHLPALVSLTVGNVSTFEPSTDESVPAVCPWNTLVISGEYEFFTASMATWLPLPASGRLVVDVSGADEGVSKLDLGGGTRGAARIELESRGYEKLPKIQLRGCRMLTVSNRGMPPDSDNLALLAALPYLAPLASPDIELVLERSEMSAEFAALLHELVAQGWSKMSLTGVIWDPVDVATPLPPLQTLALLPQEGHQMDAAHLEDIRQCVTSAEVFSAWWRLDCQPAPDTRLPWRTTKESWFHVSTFLGLAELIPDMLWDLGCLQIGITQQQAESGEYLQLAERLRSVSRNITRVKTVDIYCQQHMSPQGCIVGEVADPPLFLRASLIVAQALTCPVDTLSLLMGQLTPALVAEFSHLPEWHTELCISLNTGKSPKQQSVLAVAKAATLIPCTFESLHVSLGECTEDELFVFVSALPGRTRDTPLTVYLSGRDGKREAAVASIRALVAKNERLFPHITIA